MFRQEAILIELSLWISGTFFFFFCRTVALLAVEKYYYACFLVVFCFAVLYDLVSQQRDPGFHAFNKHIK